MFRFFFIPELTKAQVLEFLDYALEPYIERLEGLKELHGKLTVYVDSELYRHCEHYNISEHKDIEIQKTKSK